MPIEELRSLLSEAAADGEPPVGDGPTAVFARAGKVRRRRRMAMTSGVAGIVVALGMAAVLLAPTRPDRPPQVPELALALELAQGTPIQDSPRLTLVKSLLPDELQVSEATEAKPADHPWLRGQMTVTDPSGATVVIYVVVEDANLEPYLRCPVEQADDRWKCQLWSVGMGSNVAIVQRRWTDAGGRIAWCVDAQKSVRLLVSVCAMNAFTIRGQMPGPIMRTSPVLTMDQLQTIAADSRWSVQ